MTETYFRMSGPQANARVRELTAIGVCAAITCKDGAPAIELDDRTVLRTNEELHAFLAGTRQSSGVSWSGPVNSKYQCATTAHCTHLRLEVQDMAWKVTDCKNGRIIAFGEAACQAQARRMCEFVYQDEVRKSFAEEAQ